MGGRRRFIKNISAFAAGLFVANKSLAQTHRISSPSNAVYQNDSDLYWKLVRESFNLDKELIYLNNGTLGPSPALVQDVVINKIQQVNRDLRYGGGEDSRASIAELIGAKSSEITITHNTTEGLNLAAWGLPLKKGDEVIMTTHEHVGNAMPWLNKRHLDGIKLKVFEPAKTHAEILEQIEALISDKTKVITVPHVSCTIGQLFPVAEICKLAKDRGIYSVIDGAHGAGALHLNMQEINPDVYASCGHKWLLGPKGTGFAYIPERMFSDLKPVFVGAYTDKSFDITVNPPLFGGYSDTAHRFDYGTQSAALKMGLKAAADYHLKIGAKRVNERAFELNEYLYQKLNALNQIDVISSNEKASRSMMLGFRHKKLDYKYVVEKLYKPRFRIRQVPESGINCLRVSTHIYNTHEQLDRFVETIAALK